MSLRASASPCSASTSQGTSKTAMESQKVSPVALKMCRAQLFNALASGSWAMMQIPADTEGSVRYDKIQWVCYAK